MLDLVTYHSIRPYPAKRESTSNELFLLRADHQARPPWDPAWGTRRQHRSVLSTDWRARSTEDLVLVQCKKAAGEE